MTRVKKVIAGVLVLSGVAYGAALDPKASPTGTLATAQTATGPSSNTLKFPSTSKSRGVIFTARNTAGTATADLQINCTGNVGDWVTVTNGSKALTVSAAVYDITYPFCEYRVNVSACSTCNVSVFYNTLPDL